MNVVMRVEFDTGKVDPFLAGNQLKGNIQVLEHKKNIEVRWGCKGAGNGFSERAYFIQKVDLADVVDLLSNAGKDEAKLNRAMAIIEHWNGEPGDSGGYFDTKEKGDKYGAN